MNKLTAIRIKNNDDTYSDQIPVSVLAENVQWDSTHGLIDVIGEVDVDINGNLQDQINEKLNGAQLNEYVANELNNDVTNWLNQNVNPVGSAVIVDSSLSISDTAADAKKVGDKISLLNGSVVELQKTVLGTWIKNYTVGKNLSTTEIIDDPDTCLSDYISVTWGTNRIAFEYTNDTSDAHAYRIWFLDENKNLIQVYVRNPTGSNLRSINTPENSVFVLFSFKKGFAGRLYSSNTAIYYIAQELPVTPGLEQNVGDLSELATSDKDNLVNAINEVKYSNIQLPIKPKDTNFFYVSPNIANPEQFVEGEYVNQTNGQFFINNIYTRSNYITIESGESYCICNANNDNIKIRYAFYDKNKTYISGDFVQLATIEYLILAPDNAKYFAISARTNKQPLMVAKSNIKIPFEEYGISYLLPQYIPSGLEQIEKLQKTVLGVYTENYTVGKNLSTTEIVDDPDTCLSDEVPVTWGTSQVIFNYTGDTADAHNYIIWFLDENKNLIKYYGRNPVGQNSRSVVTPDNAAFVLFSFKKGFAGKLYSSNTDVYYTAQKLIVTPGLEQNVGDLSELETSNKDSLVKSINEVKRSNVSLPIKPKDTNFFYVSPNIADPEEFVEDEFVNQTNGQFVSHTSHTRSGYIPVEAGATYCIVNKNVANLEIRYAFYTSKKVYILGAIVSLATVDYVVTAPDNAAYMAISTSKGQWPLMVAKSDELIPYEEFGYTYLLPEYLLPYESVSDVVVNLPSKLYAYVGYELNVYFENIVEDWTKYKWDVTCSKGRQTERGFTVTPSANDTGTYTLTITLYLDETNKKIVSTSLVITDVSAGSGETKSIIILGDSTTYNGIAVTKLNENFSQDTMAISTIGTMGTAPNNHEGRSGWKMDDYFTKEYITYPASDPRGTINNPFYNPTTQTFDASYYFNNSGVSTPDWFFINMGINDMFSYTSDSALESAIDTAIGLFNSAINSIKNAAPSTKIGVCLTIPPNHSQDAFGKAYKTSQTRNRYKRNNLFWVNRLISEYDNRENENLYLVPIYTNLDTIYNMGMESLPVNARNTDITYQSPISNGGVHPVTSGYWQIADVYIAFLKANV